MSLDQYAQNIALSSGEFEAEQKYWLWKLHGEVVISAFPTVSDSGALQNIRETAQYDLGVRIGEKLLEMSRNSEFGAFMILSAAFKYLLFRYTGNEDVIIGMPVFKSKTEADPVTSLNSIVLLRSTIDESLPFKDLLLEVRKTVTEADENSNFPYHKLSGMLNLDDRDDQTPYIKTMVLMEEIHDRRLLKTVRTDAVFVFSLKENSLKLNIEFNGNLYPKEMMDGVARHFTNILYTVTQNPTIILSEIDFLDACEKRRILFELNDTQAAYPKEKTIHQLFADQAAKTPENIAAIFRDKKITYRELKERSERLAGHLRDFLRADAQNNPGRIIGIMAKRSLDMIIGALAVLKAGGAYLPIDPDYPREKIHYMLEDSGASVLLTQRSVESGRLKVDSGQLTVDSYKNITVIDLEDEELYGGDGAYLEEISKPDDLAYIIYTSGTTGKSKGVMIEHRNVVRLLFNDKMQFDFNEKDVWTMFHSFCFDFSVWEMYGALLYGGTLVIVPKSTAQDPAEYLKLLKEERVTVLNQTPAAFYRLAEEELKSPEQTLALRYVIFGGEALKPLMLKKWRHKYPKVKLINMYGITETTVHVTYKEITEKEIDLGISNIGKPIPTLTTYILDKKLRLLPFGAVGELCVGGDGVGRGYLNRPELAAEKFISNPFFAVNNEGSILGVYPQPEHFQTSHFKLHPSLMYRSGDLARLLPDGDMEYFGRLDHQVKIRGHRVELGEIESVLLKYGPIKEVVAIAGEDEDKNQYICAYFVAEKDLTVTELREFLVGELPGYMIPSYFMRLGKIPMTTNNKVDRKSLPQPGGDTNTGQAYAAPRNDNEEKLVEIWQTALNAERIGIHDNFFTLGGDSIKAISLINKVNRVLGTDIAIKDLYMYQTVGELAAYIDNETAGTQGLIHELNKGLAVIDDLKKTILADEESRHKLPEGYEDFYPLSPIQQGMVFFTMLRPDEPIYHDQFPYVVKMEKFALDIFNDALRLLAERHPILRTTFMLEQFSQPLQIVHCLGSGIIVPAQLNDLSGLDEKEQGKKIYEYMEDDLKHKFKFDNELLWRLRVFNLGKNNYSMVLSFQHAVLDGWSVAILMTELFEVYHKLVAGEKPEFKDLKSSYKDYVALNMSRGASENIREFWKNTLLGYTRNKLPFNISGKQISNATGSKILRLDLDTRLLKTLEEKAKNYNCTIKDICLAAHVYLLGIINTDEDIVTGVVTHDRPAFEDGEKVLGCFLNSIPIRVKTESEVKKAEILATVKNAFINAKAHELFLADIANIAGERADSGNPIFDTLHNFTDFHVLKSVEESGLVDQAESGLNFGSNEMTNTLFDLEVHKTLNVLSLQIKYAPSYFHEAEMRTVADLYVRILEEFAYHDGEYLVSEELLTREQFKEIVYDFNNTKTAYAKEKTMHRLFEEQAAKTPDNIALVLDDTQMTYRELNEKANQLTGALLERGVKPGDHIALSTQRGMEMIIGMFAILKCGGAYVPIDPEYPLAKQKYIIDNSKVTAVLSDQKYEIEHENIILIDYAAMNAYPAVTPGIKKDAKGLAYVIYTSGSTGLPKGVMIEHHSAVNLISWVNKEFNVGEDDNLLFITSMCFDLSVYDIFGTLAVGGKVVIARKEQVQNPDVLKQMLVKYRITFWNSVPSTMNYLVNALDDSNEAYTQKDLRLVFMSGDWIPVKLPGRLKKYFPKAQVISLGGATEGTVWSNFYPVAKVDEYQTSIPYGKPIANNYFYILDKNLRVLPKGVAGELFIGGVGVARGYMNDEERTKASFIRNRFCDAPDEMMYKTGDLGRMLSDGNMEFLGRIDYQVKIRGYRVEPGEIETWLLRHESVTEAVVVAQEDDNSGKYLCAYVVAGRALTVAELRDHLAKTLPDYMIPSYFIQLDNLPLTPNGKIDRKALASAKPVDSGKWLETGGAANTGIEFVAPQNEMETKLVDIWQEILGIERIGVNDGFFELGGDSLKAIRLRGRLQSKYNLDFELKDLFVQQTVKKLSLYTKPVIKTNQGIISGETEFSQAQRWFWQDYQFSDMHYWNSSQMFYAKDGFQKEILEAVLEKIVEHHDALRTVFKMTGDRVIQYTRGLEDARMRELYSLKVFDLTSDPGYAEKVLQGAIEAQGSLDLSYGPILKLVLFKTDDGDHLLIIVHHLVSDAISFQILMEDISAGYLQKLNGHEIKFPAKTVSFREWTEKLNRLANDEKFLEEITYWRKMEDENVAILPKDKVVIKNKNIDSIIYSTALLNEEENGKLSRLAIEEYQTDIKDLIASALGMSMKEWTGEDKILMEVQGHGRDDIFGGTDVSRTMGWFAMTFPVILDMSKTDDIRGQITSIKEMFHNIPNKGMGYQMLRYLTTVEAKKGLKFSMKPEIFFNYSGQEENLREEDFNSGFRISPLAKYDTRSPNSERQKTFVIFMSTSKAGLRLSIDYNQYEYEESTILKIINLYRNNLLKILDGK